MAALTADRTRDISAKNNMEGLPPMDVAASTTLYMGGFVSRDATGNAVMASDTAGEVVVGVCPEGVDNSAGSAGDKTVAPQNGQIELFEIVASSLTKADIGLVAVISTDQDLTDATTATNDIPAGRVVGIVNGKVAIRVGDTAIVTLAP